MISLKTILVVLAAIVLLKAGLWPLIAAGYGWHVARKIPLRGRRRTVILL